MLVTASRAIWAGFLHGGLELGCSVGWWPNGLAHISEAGLAASKGASGVWASRCPSPSRPAGPQGNHCKTLDRSGAGPATLFGYPFRALPMS